ncbi:MAG: cytochrome c oxidase subunit II [Schleiferiaceae bacterium]|nr:MAG: Alternative cytochrome c oxidase subunit 2 [Cryomorphaceae bacterium]
MSAISIIVLVVLVVLTVVQVMRISEISSEIQKGKDNEVTEKDNDTQGTLMLLVGFGFIISVIVMYVAWGKHLLPTPASEHGAEIDSLWNLSMLIINIVFFIVQPILFYFAFKYRGKKGTKAVYYEHNNKLELFWTMVPAVALAVLIIWGLNVWSTLMMPENEEEPIIVELYAQQFNWTARYSGGDNTLGYATVHEIGGANIVGVDPADPASMDDVVTKVLHLPVGKPIKFQFRSQDVIHSAYFPHFRAQMNCVPGAITNFQFTPSITTAEIRQNKDVKSHVEEVNAIRKAKGEDVWEFNYVLLCNKICGAAHYNMQLEIIVETEDEFNAWLKEQKTVAETL